MPLDYQRDEHRVHLIVYHLIWTPKRRKAVLHGLIARDCEKLIRDKCAEHEWEVLRIAVMPDHVHLFVRVRPTDAASEVVKECKGITSRVLRQTYTALLKLPSLWTRSYFASVIEPSAAQIADYTDSQKGI